MAKARVYELAKELGVGNKEILEQLKKKNVEVKNHMSTVEDNVAEEIRRENAGRNEEPAKAEPAAEKAGEKDSTVPKKKNLAFVVRPQNSRNSSRLQGNKRPGANQGRGAAQGNARGGENRPVRAAGAEGRPVRTERAAQAGTRQEKTDRAERTVRTERPAQTAGRTSGEGRPVRQERNDRPQRPGSDRENRPVRDSRDARGGRPNGDGRGQRQERGPRDNRDARGGREQGFGGRDNRDGRNGQGSRPDRKNDNRRNDRADRDAAPIVEQQKSQRNKAKDKERDNKKKEYRDEAFEGKGKKGKKQKNVVEVKKPQNKPEEKKEEQIKQIVIPEVLTIKELADKMKIVPSVIVKKLFLQGKVVTVNQEIDYDTAEEIAMEFDVLCEKEEVVDVIEELLKEDEEDESLMVKRPPVVCVMGHVDHGKTSLLDAIRDSNVTGREAGGITQHIGASVVEINGEKITFLDTPGHEAFTAMRMRGANSTDIAILVVAADDGVMPQTIEAINHAKAAGIEIIVAINKIDKPSANIERVKQELTEYELIPEDWGGSTIFVPVSAHTKEGIQELLEMILLTAEVMELKANPNRAARGLVIEAELDKGKGAVATVLVQKGTLHVGDAIAAGSAHGRVRAMMDDKGRRVKEAGPSQPVEILGLNDVPNAGEVFVGCASDKEARAFAETFISQNKVKLLEETKSKMSLDDLFNQIQEGNLKELDIVVKADVQGSVEAIKQSLLKLSNDEVVVKIIHGGVGAINESDVILASASNAIIIGFNVRPDATAKEIAEREGVELRLYRVIYNVIEDVEAAMKGMLDPVFEEKVLGHAEVRQTFKASGVGTIAGAYVLDGIFERNCSVRLVRDGIVVFDGPLASLKRFKDDVKEVRAGYECGFVFENYNDIKEGDQVEAYKMVETERK
ncbi:translation initiation factor IF-2 [[Ruminococcus] lactaris]|uniref:translation initiation factor IF-2 n=1 Tax=[Ruminococcus] lactaris TaxID=46228 RepID=UPI001D05B27E|nr:translation initiation factor IF-2 [[Ruminococcus] lactaris]MCB5539343.1 translation initiation factor IF-2 [[Ruminococcus] lactaris]MCB5553828.1 translation initiation factor IF-2 [[Ruminococcus] lactaris]MCB5738779.1 translation initiation factor IF-2 [[Ruminococcus] lactaris]MCB5831943.1 translation initiation factor IF-2 [[Ruminococcus] lactaris]MCB5846932.1 translation initiation factor IF-2 [[Ruminococcus] lactaris]